MSVLGAERLLSEFSLHFSQVSSGGEFKNAFPIPSPASPSESVHKQGECTGTDQLTDGEGDTSILAPRAFVIYILSFLPYFTKEATQWEQYTRK